MYKGGDIMAEFCERLSIAMNNKGISQAELCSKTKIPKSAMSQYMSGAFKPKLNRTYLIAQALSVSPSWLMGMTDDELWDKESNEFLVKMYNEEVAYKELLKQAFDNEEDIEIAYDIITNLYTLDTKGLKNVRSMEKTIIEIGGYDKMK